MYIQSYRGGICVSVYDIYDDIAKRTDSNIYIGVIGAVRTGKSTFIKRFMDSLVLPNIQDEYTREPVSYTHLDVYKRQPL